MTESSHFFLGEQKKRGKKSGGAGFFLFFAGKKYFCRQKIFLPAKIFFPGIFLSRGVFNIYIRRVRRVVPTTKWSVFLIFGFWKVQKVQFCTFQLNWCSFQLKRATFCFSSICCWNLRVGFFRFFWFFRGRFGWRTLFEGCFGGPMGPHVLGF